MQPHLQRLFTAPPSYVPDPHLPQRDHHRHQLAWHQDQEVMWTLGVHYAQLAGMSGQQRTYSEYNGPYLPDTYLPAAAPQERSGVLLGHDLTNRIVDWADDAACRCVPALLNTVTYAGLHYGRFRARLSATLAQQPASLQRHVSEQACVHRQIKMPARLFAPSEQQTQAQLQAILEWTLSELLPPALRQVLAQSAPPWQDAFRAAEVRGAAQCLLPVPEPLIPPNHPVRSAEHAASSPGADFQTVREHA